MQRLRFTDKKLDPYALVVYWLIISGFHPEEAGSIPAKCFMIFRGMKVFEDNGYPAVYWPTNPLARKHGEIRIHRVIAFEKFGIEVKNMCIHHILENTFNELP